MKCTLSCIIRTLEVVITTEKNYPSNLPTRFMYFSAMSAILIVWTTPLTNFYFTPFSNSVHMMTYETMIMKYPISHEKNHTQYRYWLCTDSDLKNKLFPKKFSAQNCFVYPHLNIVDRQCALEYLQFIS